VTSLEKNEPFGNVAEALTGQVKRLIKNIEGMAKQGQAAHEVERTLWQSVLALGRELMQVFFDSLGDGGRRARRGFKRGSYGAAA